MRLASILLALLVSVAAPAGANAQGATEVERAVARYDAGQREEAKRTLERLADKGRGSPEASYWLGRLALREEEWDRAQEWLERAVERSPNHADYHFYLGVALGERATRSSVFTQARLAGRIRDAFERAVRLDPSHLEARSGLVTFYLQAPGVMGGDKGKALREATEILARDAYLGTGEVARVHMAMEKPELAVKAWRDLIEAFPDSVAPRVNLAVLHHQLRQWDEALALLRPLAAASPPSWSAVYQVGRTGALSGQRLDEAERALRRYIEDAPAESELPVPSAWWRLGMVLQHRGDTAGARQAYETALRLNPELVVAREALQALK